MRKIEQHEIDNILRIVEAIGPDDFISRLETLVFTSTGVDKEDAELYLEYLLSL